MSNKKIKPGTSWREFGSRQRLVNMGKIVAEIGEKRPIMRFAATVSLTSSLIVGCSIGHEEIALKPTITEAEAMKRTHDYILAAAAVVAPAAKIELFTSDTSRCDDPTDHGPKGRVTAGTDYWIRGLPESDMPGAYNAFLNWLNQNNFAILMDDRPKRDFVWAENRADGFRITLSRSSGVDAVLTSASPCVWPDGTPAPKP